MAGSFELTPDELRSVALTVHSRLRSRGYRVTCEPEMIDYPSVPTMVAKRRGRTIIAVVSAKLGKVELGLWAAYGRVCSADTRVVFGVPAENTVPAKVLEAAGDTGVGIWKVEGTVITKVSSEKDLTAAVSLTPSESLSQRVRSRLGAAYEKFEEKEIADGLEEACRVLEVELRKYFWQGVRTQGVGRRRIEVLDRSGKIKTYRKRDVDRMPLGTLGKEFERIKSKNAVDARVIETVIAVNPDRVAAAHHRSDARKMRRLRREINKHIWRIERCLDQVLNSLGPARRAR